MAAVPMYTRLNTDAIRNNLCINERNLLGPLGLYCDVRRPDVIISMIPSLFGMIKNAQLRGLNEANKKGMALLKNYNSHVISTDEREFEVIQMKTRDYSVVLAAPTAAPGAVVAPVTEVITLGTSIASNTPAVNDATFVCATDLLSFYDSATGYHETMLVDQVVSASLGTVQVIRNYTSEAVTLNAIPAGSTARILLNATGDTLANCRFDCCQAIPQPCCFTSFIQRSTHCESVDKGILFKKYRAELGPNWVQRTLHMETMHSLAERITASLYDNRPVKFLDATTNDWNYVSPGLNWYMEKAPTEFIDTCCIATLYEPLRRFNDVVPWHPDGLFDENDTVVVLSSGQAVNWFQQFVNKNVVIQLPFDQLTGSAEAVYKGLSDYYVLSFRVGGRTFIVLESDYMTQFYPYQSWVINWSTLYGVVMPTKSTDFNGHRVTQGGFLRDVTNIEDLREHSSCPVKVTFEMNWAISLFCPEVNRRLLFVECNPCDGTLVYSSGGPFPPTPGTSGGVVFPHA